MTGLYASNNKAALITLLLCLLLKFNNISKLNITVKTIGFLIIFSVFIYFVRVENLLFDLNFTSRKMIDMGFNYGIENNRSSFINYFYSTESNSFVRFIILLLGQIAFLINRSELGVYFFQDLIQNRSELLLGTGPFNLSNHYGDIDISTIRISTGTPLWLLLLTLFFFTTIVIFWYFRTSLFCISIFKK